ncbi:MAG: HU family DNA-binding protein [Alphaproteobacteria bacterium]
MNKNDLVSHVATTTGLTKTQATTAVNSVFDAITSALGNRDEVRLVGFGTFSVSERRATEGRNPRTGEKISIPATRIAKFKAGKALKETVAA